MQTRTWMSNKPLKSCRFLLILEGNDRVDSIDVVGTVPKDAGEVVGVRREVGFDFMAEAAVSGEGVHLAIVLNYLGGRGGVSRRGQGLYLRQKQSVCAILTCPLATSSRSLMRQPWSRVKSLHRDSSTIT